MFKSIGRFFWRHKFKVFFSWFTFGVISTSVSSYYYTKHQLIPRFRKIHAPLTKHLPAVIADLELLASQSPFAATNRLNNADSLISRYLSWRGKVSRPPAQNRQVFDKVQATNPQWQANDNQLQKMVADPLLQQVETDWLKELAGFDHWDFSVNPNSQEFFQSLSGLNNLGRIAALAALPHPDFNELHNWALLHLIKETNSGRATEGFKVFRQIATLCHSTGILFGQLTAAAMLLEEHEFLKNTPQHPIRLIDVKVIKAYQRASWFWLVLANYVGIHELPVEVVKHIKPEAGACSSLWEWSSRFAAYPDFFLPKAPLEMKFAREFERSRAFFERVAKVCKVHFPVDTLQQTPENLNPLLAEPITALPQSQADLLRMAKLINVSRIPFARRILGVLILSVATPDYFNAYEEK